jgi:hypothetical protein
VLAFISTGWLVFIGLLILVGLANLILGSQKYAGRMYNKVAGATGMSYDLEAKGLRALGCEGLPVLMRLKARRNLLHGTVDGVETVFVEVGKEGEIEDPLVPDVFSALYCFRLPGRALPPFQLFKHDGKGKHALDAPDALRPKHYSIIELRENPGFQDFYFLLALRAEDEGALRELFTREVQDFFVESRIADAQGGGEWVGAGYLVPMGVKDFQETMRSARRVHKVFARGTG